MEHHLSAPHSVAIPPPRMPFLPPAILPTPTYSPVHPPYPHALPTSHLCPCAPLLPPPPAAVPLLAPRNSGEGRLYTAVATDNSSMQHFPLPSSPPPLSSFPASSPSLPAVVRAGRWQWRQQSRGHSSSRGGAVTRNLHFPFPLLSLPPLFPGQLLLEEEQGAEGPSLPPLCP